jgi:hypothetical protein
VINPVRCKWFSRVAVPLACAAFTALAQAEPVDISLEPLPTQTVIAWPASHLVNEFTSSVAGTVTLSVYRVDWADLLSQLSTVVALTDKPHLSNSGDAQFIFDITAGERFTTSIFALAAGPRGYGAYSLDVDFLPRLGGVTQVPLPAAGWLLLSALGGLGAVSRRRAIGV